MIQVRLPSGRVVPVNTDDPKIAAATARAYVQRDPYESAHATIARHPIMGAITGAAETVARALPGVSELQAGLSGAGNLGMDFLTGKQHLDPKDLSGSLSAAESGAWQRARAVQQAEVDSFHGNHPAVSAASTGIGLAAPVAAAIATGGLTEAPELAAATERGIAGLLKRTAVRGARRATAGGAAGAAYGAGQPGTVSDRLHSADQGAKVGAVIGAIAPPAINLAAKGVTKTATGVASTLTRAANKSSGGALLDANQVAAQRLVESLKADGATPDLIRTALNGFLKNGAADPSLIDVATRLPSGGQNTMALVRAAAAKGSGRGVAVNYGDQVAADLQDNAIARTRQLTPDTRSAPAVKAAATTARDQTATQEYRAPYGEPVDARPLVPAIEGDAGRVGLNSAYKDADALRLPDEMDEIGKLRTAAAPPEPTPTPVARIGADQISTPALEAKIRAALGLDAAPTDAAIPVRLGTLDRVKIALNDAGQDAAAKGLNSRAAGFFDRAKEIDDHLADQNPGYATARDNYAKASAGIDALDHGGTGITAVPDDYAANLHDFLTKGGPDAGKMAAIGYRQALTDAIGAPTEAATGSLNKVSTSTNQGRNLEATFGPEHAQAYRDGLSDLVDQLNNARFINPNTNSATAGRLADLGLVESPDIAAPKLGPVHLILGAVNKIKAGATLTDGERAAIAQIGTARANPDAIDLTDQVKLLPSQALQDAQALGIGVGSGDQKRAKNQ